MTRDISEDPSSKTARSDRPKKGTGAGGELELVLKTGSVYCFVKRISPPDSVDRKPSRDCDDESDSVRAKAVSSLRPGSADLDSRQVRF